MQRAGRVGSKKRSEPGGSPLITADHALNDLAVLLRKPHFDHMAMVADAAIERDTIILIRQPVLHLMVRTPNHF